MGLDKLYYKYNIPIILFTPYAFMPLANDAVKYNFPSVFNSTYTENCAEKSACAIEHMFVLGVYFDGNDTDTDLYPFPLADIQPETLSHMTLIAF